MRIAYVCQTYPPILSGVSTVMCGLAEGMRSRGHSCLVIVASDTGAPYSQNSNNLKIVRFRSFVTPIAAKQRFMPFPARRINAELHAFDPDIVHVHDPFLTGLLVIIKKRSQAAWRLVYTAHLEPESVSDHMTHLFGFRGFVNSMFEVFGKWIVSNSDAIIAPSQFLAANVARRSGYKPQVISNGIDTVLFNPSANGQKDDDILQDTYDLYPGTPTILHVGRLSKEKGVEMILQAAAQVMQDLDAQLVIVGDGPAKGPLMRLATDLGIRERTLFTGFIPRNGTLTALYRFADVFALTSEYEAQGIVILEALASGLPVVAIGSSAIPELITDGVNGHLVSPGDMTALATRIQSILQNPKKAAQMGNAGRAVAESHALEGTISAHEKLYESLS